MQFLVCFFTHADTIDQSMEVQLKILAPYISATNAGQSSVNHIEWTLWIEFWQMITQFEGNEDASQDSEPSSR